jgi:hypothetical protein
VKPLLLTRWLLRLVLPPGGTVLDPFLGSGTTAEAAIVRLRLARLRDLRRGRGSPRLRGPGAPTRERALSGRTPGTEEGDAWAASEAQRFALRQAGQGSLF